MGALLLVGLGVVIGRVTAPAPEAVDDAPSDEPAEGSGPSRTEAGVPVGYARTEAGAAAAAAQNAAALDDGRGLVDAERDAVLDVIAAEDARDQLADSMAPGTEMLVESLGLTPEVVDDPGFVARSVIAGYQLDDYDGDEASVLVWGTSIFFANGRQALSDAWATQRVSLRWERDDWRLVALDSEQGPTPPTTPTPTDPDVGERINAFDRYVHVPPANSTHALSRFGLVAACGDAHVGGRHHRGSVRRGGAEVQRDVPLHPGLPGHHRPAPGARPRRHGRQPAARAPPRRGRGGR